MKRFLYNVEEFTPDSEAELGLSQEANDRSLIAKLFHEFKLDPSYSEYERSKYGIDYIGHLDYQLFNWEGEGGKVRWLEHTEDLFKNEQKNSVTAKPQVFTNIDGWFCYNLVSNLSQL